MRTSWRGHELRYDEAEGHGFVDGKDVEFGLHVDEGILVVAGYFAAMARMYSAESMEERSLEP